MGQRKRFKIRHKQRLKRRKRLSKLRKNNLDISDYFCDGHYVGPGRS